MMKKSNRKELNWEQTEKLVTLALEENPFEIIKRNLAWSKRSFGNNEEDGREI
jgi:hypothetical protein